MSGTFLAKVSKILPDLIGKGDALREFYTAAQNLQIALGSASLFHVLKELPSRASSIQQKEEIGQQPAETSTSLVPIFSPTPTYTFLESTSISMLILRAIGHILGYAESCTNLNTKADVAKSTTEGEKISDGQNLNTTSSKVPTIIVSEWYPNEHSANEAVKRGKNIVCDTGLERKLTNGLTGYKPEKVYARLITSLYKAIKEK